MFTLPYIGLRHKDDIKCDHYIGNPLDFIGWLLTVIGVLQGTQEMMWGVKTGLIYDVPDFIKHGRIRSIMERYAESHHPAADLKP